MGLPLYCTVEDLKRAFDSKESARNDTQLRRGIESASRLVEQDTHRFFYPLTTTRYFEWPNPGSPTPWRLWLDDAEIVSLTSLTAAGTAISTANVFLEPNSLGPPYNRLEIDKSTRSAFAAGTTTQRAIAVTGTFGYCDTTESAGTLAAAVSTTSATTLTVSDSSLIGNGDTVKVDSERMLVTGRTMTTTSQTLLTPVGALVSDVTLAVTTGSSYAVGETLLLDSERMLIVDISGNNLTVKRAWDGTVLAAHTGSTIYAPRLLTVTRGLTGTTAATHLNAAAVSRQTVPGPIKDLTIAYALDRFLQETSGYARNIVGTGDRMTVATGGALPNLRKQVIEQYGRVRMASI
jgi:hypothetical protein